MRWVIRKSNTLRGIIVCLSIHLSALSIITAAAAAVRRVSQQACLHPLTPPPPPPQPGAGKRLRNGHCFFGGEPQCCSLKHFNRRNSNTRRKKEAGLRDKQNPPRHKPVPDFLPQPLFSSRVRVCFLIFFFFSVKFTRGASADLHVFEQTVSRVTVSHRAVCLLMAFTPGWSLIDSC